MPSALRPGERRRRTPAGFGPAYDNHGAPTAVGAERTAYAKGFDGTVAVRDTAREPEEHPDAAQNCTPGHVTARSYALCSRPWSNGKS